MCVRNVDQVMVYKHEVNFNCENRKRESDHYICTRLILFDNSSKVCYF